MCNLPAAGLTIAALIALTASFTPVKAKSGPLEEQTPASLQRAFADDFLVGTAVRAWLPGSSEPKERATMRLIDRQYSAVTPENCMKWARIHPKPGEYDFANADALVKFAEQNEKHVFGHTLIWHAMTPGWVFQDDQGQTISREALTERLREHMETVMGRYKGKVDAWDVVNEAVANHGGNDHGLRDSKWRQILGDNYLAQAFRMAHEIDPDATLIYNDYGWHKDSKRKRAIKLLRGLIDQGVPIDAIGVQAHWNIHGPSPEKLQMILDDIAELGLPIHISEMDMNVLGKGKEADRYKDALPPKIARKQAHLYASWFEVFKQNAGRIDRVAFWAPSDAYSWLNNMPVRGRTNYPVLFDRENQPKRAFDAVVDVANTDKPQ